MLDLANSSATKPRQCTEIGMKLIRFTNQKSSTFNSELREELKAIRPEWFKTETVSYKKQKLVFMAENKLSRPVHTSKIGQAVGNYTSGHGGAYDASFDVELRSLSPKWFRGRLAKYKNTDFTKPKKPRVPVSEKKAELLRLASTGKGRPNYSHPYGNVLGGYICKTSNGYDEAFSNQIRSLRPDWFK